jgi:hypothetical protein
VYADVIAINIAENTVQLTLWDKLGVVKNIGDF